MALNIEGDNSILDCFHNVKTIQLYKPIDLRDISQKWVSSVDYTSVIHDIKELWIQHNHEQKNIAKLLSSLPLQIHSDLVQWAIEEAYKITISKIRDRSNVELIKLLFDFYRKMNLLIYVRDLRHSRIYEKYKSLDNDIGSSWYSTTSTPSTTLLAIGHLLDDSIKLFNPINSSWTEFSSIHNGFDNKHTYGFFIFEEKIPQTLNVVLKIKYEKDTKMRGVVLNFLQITELTEIAKAIKADIKKINSKTQLIESIKKTAEAIQEKIYPNRVIYKLVDI
jgi:hypothetical protein